MKNPYPACKPARLVQALVVFVVASTLAVAHAQSSTPYGRVQVGFVVSNPPTELFQRILLNVVSVRLNPSKNTGVSETDSGWVTIPVPQNYNGNPTMGLTELQIDLNPIQGQAELFNTSGIPARAYYQVELKLDPNNPGYIVPLCQGGPTPREGCISYRLRLKNPNTPLRAHFKSGAGFHVGPHRLNALVIDFDPNDLKAPNNSTQSYKINPSISVVDKNTNQPWSNLVLAQMQGSVTGGPAKGETVTAELGGTGIIIAKTKVSHHQYSMALPAALGTGTSYDLYISGGGASYQAFSGITVTQGGSYTQDFAVVDAPTAAISGTITSACTGNPIEAAKIALLVPASGSGANCTTLPVAPGCVVVAGASTDNVGFYPLPRSTKTPDAFQKIPVGSNYGLLVSSAGFSPVLSPVSFSGGRGVCSASVNGNGCGFSLDSATINGTVALSSPPPAGVNTQVLVAAEDAGTNHLENVTLVTIPSGVRQAPFSLNVPAQAYVPTFDLFASSMDLFAGQPEKFSSHTYAVAAGVAGAAACTTSADTPTLSALSCVGHGSLAGTVASPFDSGTTVRLLKDGVQLMDASVVPSGFANPGAFSFCAPPDSYSVQRFEAGTPAGSAVAVTVEPPTALSGTCTTACTGSGSCSVCTGTSLGGPL